MECFLPNYELITQTSKDHAYVALYLEIVRQFWSPCITRIHGDCHKTVWVKVQFCSFKHKLVLVSSYTTLDAQNLEEKKLLRLHIKKHYNKGKFWNHCMWRSWEVSCQCKEITNNYYNGTWKSKYILILTLLLIQT